MLKPPAPLSLRADFPIFAHHAQAGQPLTYLDSASSTQKPQAVLQHMQRFYETRYANVHRGLYNLSQEATQDYEAARHTVARFLGAPDTESIIFTKGSTEAINLVAATWGNANIKEGDRLLLSAMEHHANIVPWQLLAARTGCHLDVIPLQADGHLDMDAYARLLTPRVKLVAVTHASNILGSITHADTLVRLAHANGSRILIDGSQAAPHMPLNMASLGADFYTFTGHKLYGPTGIGVLYGKKELLNEMPPYQGGGDMIDNVSFSGTTFAEAPARFEAGTPNIAGAIGLAAAIDYLQSHDSAALCAHETTLTEALHHALTGMKGIRLYGPHEQRIGVFGFALEGAHSSDVAHILSHMGICVRSGHHCAMPLMEALGVAHLVRASIGLYNDIDDIERLMEGLHKAVKMLV